MARKPKTKPKTRTRAATEELEQAEEPSREKALDRDDELLGDKKLEDKCRKIAKDVGSGFQSQWERGNDQLDFWDIYDMVLGGHQTYAGNSQIFIPIVNTAVEARVTRFTNQIFPRSGRQVECTTSDEKPYDIMSLCEHYIRKTKLRTQVVPALIRNGDIEGQYNLYVGWENQSRHIVYRGKPQLEIKADDNDPEPIEIEQPDAEDEDIVEEETFHMQPVVEVLADTDVLILPHTANNVGGALQKGGSVTVIRRWTEERIQQAIDDKEISEDEGEALIKEMSDTKEDPGSPDANKKHVDAAGITMVGGIKHATVYEVWTYLKIEKIRRLSRFYYAGGSTERLLSIKRCPYWNDKCPVLSAPLKKISNVFKGKSELKRVADLQYAANDTINETMDSAQYALLPIVMTDPSKNPRVGSMVLNLAAIWETNPNDTQFAKFPELWKDGLSLVAALKNEIFQILSVTPAMLPQQTGAKNKRNQAEIAAEQQVEILSVADVCTNLEDEILTPLLRWFVELDYQFRDKPLTVRQYGQMGMRAAMQDIPPVQSNRRYEFRWFGIEAARNAQMLQQQIGSLNVVRGIPPEQYKGYELNLVPVISLLIENTFGPRLAPEIFKDIKSQLTIDPEMENEFLSEGLALPVHALDNDQEHMQAHIAALKAGDPTGAVREHMMMHRFQMEKKQQVQMASMMQMQRGQPGVPGGNGPGVAGSPRMGAQPGQVRGGQQPPGAIHADRMQGTQAPRR